MTEPSDAERAWADYKPSLRDLITELIGRKGYVPPEWTAYFDEKYMRLRARNLELEKQVANNPFADMINVGVDQAERVSSESADDRDKYALNAESFTFELVEYSDHYELSDDTQFPSSRINKPVSPTAVQEMIFSRVTERAHIIANQLTEPVYEAEVRRKLQSLINGFGSTGMAAKMADAILENFDVRFQA